MGQLMGEGAWIRWPLVLGWVLWLMVHGSMDQAHGKGPEM